MNKIKIDHPHKDIKYRFHKLKHEYAVIADNDDLPNKRRYELLTSGNKLQMQLIATKATNRRVVKISEIEGIK